MVHRLAVLSLALSFGSSAFAADAMIVRNECFGGGLEEMVRRPARPAPSWGGSGGPSAPMLLEDESSATPARSGANDSARRQAESSRKLEASKRAAEERSIAPVFKPTMVPPSDAPNDSWTTPWTGRPSTPSFDWGGRTWLSNDDSMSLASAQRVLWAAKEGRAAAPSEVRPHELLNYFTFDTEQPSRGDTFEVTASAETHGDTLSLALAVQGATPTRQPLDLTLLVDRSGSMRAEARMDYVKRGLRTVGEQLKQGDRVDLVLFDNAVCTPLENYVHGRDDPRVLNQVIAQMQPAGGTNLNRGLEEAYAVAKRKTATHRRNRRVMLLTDAMLNSGNVDPHTVSSIGERYESDGIRLTGIGVGRDFNDDVLDRLTEKGKGAYVYLGSEAVVDRVFGSGFDALVQTLAHDVRFRLDLPDSLALEKFYGEEASTDEADIQPIHYYAGTSQVFLQDLKMRSATANRRDPVVLEVSWRDAVTGEPESRRFSATIGQMLDADPHNVRKARALMAFSDVLLARSMGGECSTAYGTFTERASGLGDDAEIAYVGELARSQCPNVQSEWSRRPVSRQLVNLKVKVDSDIPVSGIAASCESGRVHESLSPADTVAQFRVSPGTCKLTLDGVVPMTTRVEVGAVDSDVRCLVRGGRLSCS